MRVLLIEDSPDDSLVIREMLGKSEGAGLDLECVVNLAAGLERIGKGGIDAVLLDLFLPDSRGLDTVKRVCGCAPELPVVVLTGLADEEAGLLAVREGAQDCFLKGKVDGDSLVRALRFAILRKRQERGSV